MTSKTTILVGVSVVALLSGGAVANAQTQAAKPAAGSSAVLEEVMVTARRRSENIERVPGTIQALGADTLAKKNIVTEADLQSAVPGLTIRQGQTQNDFNYAIRGQTIDSFSGSRPAVLGYINEFQVQKLGAGALYDLESVQVLKGPQGTLFGRNVTGGAVLYSTAKAGPDLDYSISAKVGNFNAREVQGFLNVPLVKDKAFLRIAADWTSQDGYQFNTFNNQRQGDTDRTSWRASLTLNPTDDLQNTTVYQQDRQGGNNVGMVPFSVYPCGTPGVAVPYSCLYLPGGGLSPYYELYVGANPKVPLAGYYDFFLKQQARGPYTVTQDALNAYSSRSLFITNTTSYQIAPNTHLKNIFGYAEARQEIGTDQDGSPFPIVLLTAPNFPNNNHFKNKQYSDEIQIQGTAFDNDLTYIAGAYYASEVDFTYTPGQYVNLPGIFPTGAALPNAYYLKDTTEAVFFQGTYSLEKWTGVQGLSLTAGYRYSWEQLKLTEAKGTGFYYYQLPPAVQGTNGFYAPSLAQAKVSPPETSDFSKPSWQVGLDYQVTPETLLYVVTRGSWRGGSYNGAAPPINRTAATNGNLFLPETTKDVEIGAKFSGRAGDVPVRLNVAAFSQTIDDIQRVSYTGIPALNVFLAAITFNVPKAQVQGIEIDGQARLTDWLTLGGNLALTDSKFKNNKVNFGGTIQQFGPMSDTPKTAGSVFADITFPMADQYGSLGLHVDYYAQSSFYFSNQNAFSSPKTELPGYGTLNARLDWKNVAGSKVGLSAFVKNATDKVYYTGGLPLGGTFGANYAFPASPRTYGVEVKYKY